MTSLRIVGILKKVIYIAFLKKIKTRYIYYKNKISLFLAPSEVKILCGLVFSPKGLLRQFAIARVQRKRDYISSNAQILLLQKINSPK
jgi:hypothetical protein